MVAQAYWAYAFTCTKALDAILLAWNDSGPWQWQVRDSHWYGDYLSCRPQEGVRVRIHEPSTPNSAYGPDDPKAQGRFTALLEIEKGSAATQPDVDAVLRKLVAAVTSDEPVQITPYD